MRTLLVLPLLPFCLALFACVAAAETSPAPTGKSGIEGVITISPTHGGPIREDEPLTAPLAKTAFVVKQEDRVVAEFETDEQGRFKIMLAPGRYSVGGKERKLRFGYGPMSVDVVAREMTRVKWDFDTGLR